MLKGLFLYYLQKFSRGFGSYHAKITYVPRNYEDRQANKYQGILYTVYPDWMTWMETTEERVCSEYGIVWFGEFSGRLDYSLSRRLEALTKFKEILGNDGFDENDPSDGYIH